MSDGSVDPVSSLFRSLLSASLPAPGLGASPPASPAASRPPEGEMTAVRADIERLLMITEALWTMMKDQFEYTDSHLIERIAEIDRRDGKLDGRVASQPPQVCPSCGRPSARKRSNCLYCGAVVPSEPFAR